jgi:protein-S-isoprenylcysteine O-methyltransferase Ste14
MKIVSEPLSLARRGAWFQGPMIILWLLRGLMYSPTGPFSTHIIATILTYVGFTTMMIAMARIYLFNKSRTLITSDMFTVTRHPMYHGMYLADLALFFAADLHDPWFWISWIAFTILIFGAAWFQEQETLARWGKEAREYYARTPRFAFEWLWKWAQ